MNLFEDVILFLKSIFTYFNHPKNQIHVPPRRPVLQYKPREDPKDTVTRILTREGYSDHVKVNVVSLNTILIVKKQQEPYVAKVSYNNDTTEDILLDLRNEYIINIIEIIKDHNSKIRIYIYPYHKNGDLFNYYEQYPELFTTEYMLNIIYDLCCIVKYLHSKNLTHNDLKQENILVDNDDKIKLIDFECLIHEKTKTLSTSGTSKYFSPEKLSRVNMYKYSPDEISNKPSDIWAIGIIVYQLTTGSDFFNENELVTITQDDINQVIDSNPYIDPFFKQFLKKVLVINIGQRAKVKELVSLLTELVHINHK